MVRLSLAAVQARREARAVPARRLNQLNHAVGRHHPRLGGGGATLPRSLRAGLIQVHNELAFLGTDSHTPPALMEPSRIPSENGENAETRAASQAKAGFRSEAAVHAAP